MNDLPITLPIFPLTGAILLPRGHLPLNIFEPRYKKMIEDARKNEGVIFFKIAKFQTHFL